MLDILYSEILKFKRSWMLWLIPIGGLFPVLIVLMAYASPDYKANYYPYYKWEFFFDGAYFYLIGLSKAVFIILAGYVFTREYQLNTINTIFTYPFSRFKVFICKLIVIFPLVFSVFLASLIFTIISYQVIEHNPLTIDVLLTFIKYGFIMTIVSMALIPSAILVSIIARNVIAPIVLGIINLLCFAAMSSKVCWFVPVCAPDIIWEHIAKNINEKHPWFGFTYALNANMTNTYITLAVFLIISSVGCVLYYKYSNVQ